MAAPLTKSSVLRRVWSVSHELPDTGQTVVFDAQGSELLVLNDAAGALWHLLDGERDLGAAMEFIREAVPSAPSSDALLGDLLPFLEELLARGAVESTAP